MHILVVILLSCITALATTAGTLYVGHRLGWLGASHAGERPVPSLVGLSEADARTNLEAIGLKLMIGGRDTHSTAAPGEIVSQSVPVGQLVPEGQAIAITLAAELPEIPDVAGLELDKATEQLKAVGYSTAVREAVPSDQVPPGHVISQIPKSGRAEGRNRVVTLFPSAGPAAVEVPKVAGLSFENAKSALTKSGLKLGKVVWVDMAETAGYLVVRQKPNAGERSKPDGEIELVVNRGD